MHIYNYIHSQQHDYTQCERHLEDQQFRVVLIKWGGCEMKNSSLSSGAWMFRILYISEEVSWSFKKHWLTDAPSNLAPKTYMYEVKKEYYGLAISITFSPIRSRWYTICQKGWNSKSPVSLSHGKWTWANFKEVNKPLIIITIIDFAKTLSPSPCIARSKAKGDC